MYLPAVYYEYYSCLHVYYWPWPWPFPFDDVITQSYTCSMRLYHRLTVSLCCVCTFYLLGWKSRKVILNCVSAFLDKLLQMPKMSLTYWLGAIQLYLMSINHSNNSKIFFHFKVFCVDCWQTMAIKSVLVPLLLHNKMWKKIQGVWILLQGTVYSEWILNGHKITISGSI